MPPRVTYTLVGADGQSYESNTPGTIGGHRRAKIYGRLDCPAALRAIARGGYVKHRVLFADEQTAIAAQSWVDAVNADGSCGEWRYTVAHEMGDISQTLRESAAL